MKALIITNMYPSETLPYSGVFVKAQYDYLRHNIAKKDRVSIFYMRQVISSGIGKYLKYLLAYLRFIPHFFKKYHVLHVHFLGMLAPVAVMYKYIRPKTKLIVTMHGGDINDDMPAEGKKNAFFRKLIKRFDHVVPVGPVLHKPLKEKLDTTPDNTLCAGIDHLKFYPLKRDKVYDFVVVGSFLPVKGIDTLIRALNQDSMPAVRICFVGNGPLELKLQELTAKHEVTILGNKNHDELREIYNQSKFLLFTSIGDAFGLVVTEAIFCGTPAIVWRHGGGAHQVIERTNGFIYDENSAESLGNCILDALQMDDQRYKVLSRSTPETNHQFALQTVCQVYYSYYLAAEKSTKVALPNLI